jgi:protein-disulfide isomerase
MADQTTAQYLNRAVEEGQQLHIANTPTVFVNGRRIIGPDRATLEQFIQYEFSLKQARQ